MKLGQQESREPREMMHTAIEQTLGEEALRYVPRAEIKSGALDRGRIRYFPVVPGRVEFTVELRRRMLATSPIVAVELPGFLEDAYEKALARLPEMSVILYIAKFRAHRNVITMAKIAPSTFRSSLAIRLSKRFALPTKSEPQVFFSSPIPPSARIFPIFIPIPIPSAASASINMSKLIASIRKPAPKK